MGLLDKISDVVVNGLSQAETIRLPYEELVKILQQKFISREDDSFLAQVQETAKGGLVAAKEIASKNGRYRFKVGHRPNGAMLLASKPVWIFDNEENKFYQLDKDGHWKRFYHAVVAAIDVEKANRTAPKEAIATPEA